MSAELKIGTRGDGSVFSVPLDVVTQRNAFLGRPGSGKSYGASKIAEEMIGAGAQVVVLDPVGIWWGLRLAKDGKAPGLPIPVFGGLHGDIPLEPTAGALVADLVVDRGISVVLDVSQFEHDTQKAKFAADFGARLFFRRKAAPAAMHVVLEECQEFVPENPQKGEERMLHTYTRMVKLGRNFGIGISLVSQRPQEVNKKALNLAECLFAFQMTGPHERRTVKDWTDFHGAQQDIRDLLPTLPIGSPYVSSPQWLRISEVVQIGEKWTFDASATPEVGKRAVARELAPIDLAKLQTEMAATLERAKAEDPKALQARIKELEEQLRTKPAAAADPAAVERAVQAERDRLFAYAEADTHRFRGELTSRLSELQSAIRGVASASTDLDGLIATIAPPKFNGSAAAPLPSPTPATAHGPRTPATPPPAARPERATGPAAGVSGSQQKILDAIATYESFGDLNPDRVAVAAMAGYRPGGGHTNNLMSSLTTAGLITSANGRLALTESGRAAARAKPIHSLADLHAVWMAILNGPQRKLLQVLLASYPAGVTTKDLATRAGFTPGAGHFNNIRSSLNTLGAIEVDRGMVRPSHLLFPEGLS